MVIEPRVARAISSISLRTSRKAWSSGVASAAPVSVLDGAQVFEQLGHVQQRCSPCIAGELISATRAANRADQAGTAHDVHDLRQMVTGDAVFLADFGDGKLTAFARGQFQNREDGKPGRNLQPHDIAIRMPLQSKS